ncbi:hypothetical protein [Agrococcus sp. SGAir0287]|uniref:hypothetical protein n=1 Tax=Agrococcus sp. SGAir0287 TaxID=2070347 RepID=UPI0010CD20B0|nr:hypothetical protein [Agrococcus sp. SGAir0287]QCR20353.1 hypothetical protein C1N71_13630 [Agrococcus sp. SGAir0287]
MATDLRFRSVWRIPAERDAVRAVLGDVDGYAEWWPSILDAALANHDSGARGGHLVVRWPRAGALRLRLAPMSSADDVLAARVSGDLLGWCSWHLSTDAAGGTCVVLQQHVLLRRGALRALARIAPRRLRTDHAAVMRAGEAGLVAHIAR